MLKKPKKKLKSKSYYTNKLDAVFSKMIRERGKCERCPETQNLQACHIYSRRYRNTRWASLNVLCLCAGCHRWGHDKPIDFTEFVKSYYGESRYQELRSMARINVQRSAKQLKELLDTFNK